MNWFEESINQYYKWLKDKTFIKQNEHSEWISVSTPFIGIFNDPIEIFMKKENDDILLSDDGLTLKNLDLLGINVNRSPKRKEWLDFILSNYGISLNDGELNVIANQYNFPQKKHNLICAISEITDLETTSKHVVSSLFRENVKNLLDEQGIIYTPQFIVKGNTGIDFIFDFQIAERDNELVLKSFNSLNRTNIPNYLFSLDDIKSNRERTSGKKLISIAIVNDIGKELKKEYVSALKSKDTEVIFWSEINKSDRIKNVLSKV